MESARHSYSAAAAAPSTAADQAAAVDEYLKPSSGDAYVKHVVGRVMSIRAAPFAA